MMNRCRVLLSGLFLLAGAQLWAQNGLYDAQLTLSDDKLLRFVVSLRQSNDSVFAVTKNGQEAIEWMPSVWRDDSVDIQHPVFDSYLRLYRSEDELTGFWHDRSRKGRYVLPLTLQLQTVPETKPQWMSSTRWLCQFDTGENEYPAVGIFSMAGHLMRGTFLTETGDYRYLYGVITPDKFFELSAFDGSHAFYFEGQMTGNALTGQFYSGNHWKTTFTGIKSDTAQLPDGFELTRARQKGPIQIKIPQGDSVYFVLNEGRYKNKPVIVQVMGTWCPNCLDETRYLLGLKDKITPMPEMVALCFERGSDTLVQLKNLERVRQNLGLSYPLLLAGNPNKKSASEVLPFMDPVLSYPTTIFLNRKHEVIGIHTGFNGPATGQSFIHQSKEFERLIKAMMKEQ